VIARHLEIRGHECRVLLLCSTDEFRGDAAANFAILQKTTVPIVNLAERAGLLGTRRGEASPPPSFNTVNLNQRLNDECADVDWLVDALLGTGAQGNPRPPFDTAIEIINSRQAPTRVLAVDVPSGLDCDTGLPSEHTVRADHTCTFAAMKTGYLQPAAQHFIGTVHVCDIGLPPRLIDEVARL
jgi:NAD(P)H-hydrate epimerase